MHRWIALLMFALPLFGQGSARISGVVTDPAGAMVAGAEVTLTNVATGQSRSILTSSEGTYTFLDVLPGSYNLTAKAQGFKTFRPAATFRTRAS
ncbi:MAG: carboxypeptidase regulatory-like domain-containing protein [Acidobacteria bacterium]|nr:carboxypeptidase regulatory-like domain-containing protein [Acidobacteriota bacterium]